MLIGVVGKQSDKVKEFLHAVESFYLSDAMCGKVPMVENVVIPAENFENILIDAKEQVKFADDNATVNLSLKNLEYFIEQQLLFVKALKKKGKNEDYEKEAAAASRYVDENEMKVQPFEDSLFKKQGLNSWISAKGESKC